MFMPRLVTTRQRNSFRLLSLVLIFLFSAGLTAQVQEQKQDQKDASSQPPSPQSSQPAQGSEDNGTFVFKKEVDEVLLHATVVDDKGHLITDLDQSAFRVLENNQQQTIISFRHEDIPVAMGIVIDNSGSMREKRDDVNKAALNLVKSSNPQKSFHRQFQ